MRERFYAILTALSKVFGTWLFASPPAASRPVISSSSPGGRRSAHTFTVRCFADRNRLYAWWCAWRQFQNFTTVFLDRYLLHDSDTITYTFEGREHLIEAVQQGRGGILLMSHMGNWEVAARLLRSTIPRPETDALHGSARQGADRTAAERGS